MAPVLSPVVNVETAHIYVYEQELSQNVRKFSILRKNSAKVPVVLKRISNQEEVCMLQKCVHSSIVQVLESCATRIGVEFVVLEFVESDLSRVLSTGMEFNPLDVTRQLLRAIAHIHKCGVIHSNLEPSNVLLSETGKVKVCDFSHGQFFGNVVSSRTPIGALWYRAPELLFGVSYDWNIDAWSAGCIVYEMVFGEALFHGATTDNDVIRQICAYYFVAPEYSDWGALLSKTDTAQLCMTRNTRCEADVATILVDVVTTLLSIDPGRREVDLGSIPKKLR